MDSLVRRGIAQLNEKQDAERMSREPIERYQWPLTAGIILIVATIFISERRQQTKDFRVANRKLAAT